MTRMTRPDCAVMCNLINTHTHTQNVDTKTLGSVDIDSGYLENRREALYPRYLYHLEREAQGVSQG